MARNDKFMTEACASVAEMRRARRAREAREREAMKGERRAVPIPGGRVIIDPLWDRPARAAARAARHATRAEGVTSPVGRVYGFMPLTGGAPSLVDAAKMVPAHFADHDAHVRAWYTARPARAFARWAGALINARLRTERFHARFGLRGPLPGPFAIRVAHAIRRAVLPVVADRAGRIATAIYASEATHGEGWRRSERAEGVMTALERLIARLDGIARWGEAIALHGRNAMRDEKGGFAAARRASRATLHGRASRLALCAEMRKGILIGAARNPADIAGNIEGIDRARGAAADSLADDILTVGRAALEGEMRAATTAVTACLSVRKARGSRARNARAEAVAAAKARAVIMRDRARRAALGADTNASEMSDADIASELFTLRATLLGKGIAHKRGSAEWRAAARVRLLTGEMRARRERAAIAEERKMYGARRKAERLRKAFTLTPHVFPAGPFSPARDTGPGAPAREAGAVHIPAPLHRDAAAFAAWIGERCATLDGIALAAEGLRAAMTPHDAGRTPVMYPSAGTRGADIKGARPFTPVVDAPLRARPGALHRTVKGVIWRRPACVRLMKAARKAAPRPAGRGFSLDAVTRLFGARRDASMLQGVRPLASRCAALRVMCAHMNG